MKIESPRPQITFGKFQNVDMRVARVVSAPRANGTNMPCRVFTLDVGPLGHITSVGQYALCAEGDLVGKNVIACINLGERTMGEYISQALVLGAPHPDSPEGEHQATPVFVSDSAVLGSSVF